MEVLATDLLDKSRHRRTCPVLGACEPVATARDLARCVRQVATFVWQVARYPARKCAPAAGTVRSADFGVLAAVRLHERGAALGDQLAQVPCTLTPASATAMAAARTEPPNSASPPPTCPSSIVTTPASRGLGLGTLL